MTIMTIVITLLLFVFCQVLIMAIEYDPTTDNEPDSLCHKMIRKFSYWIFGEEEFSNV